MDVAQPVVMPTPAPMPAPTPQNSPAPTHSRKGLCIALVVIVFLLGGGAAAAYYYLNVLTQTPEKVMAQMFTAMQGVSSASVDATLQGNGTGISESSLYMTDEDDGTAKAYGLSVETQFRFDDVIRLFDGTASFAATANGEDVTSLEAQIRSAADVDYVYLTSLVTPAIPEELQSGIALGLNRWIVIDRGQIAKDLGIDAFLAQLQAAGEGTDRSAALDMVLDEHLPQTVAITEVLASESVNGVASHHYAYALNKNAVGEMLDALSAAAGGDEDFEDIRSFLGESGDVTGELWVGKQDDMLYKLTANTVMKGAQQFALALSVTFSEYGTPFTVDAPEGATPVGDLLIEILEKVSEEAKADNDGDGLQNSDEDTYGTDRANADTDGDGYTDGAEVEGGFNPNGEGELVDLSDDVLETIEFDD